MHYLELRTELAAGFLNIGFTCTEENLGFIGYLSFCHKEYCGTVALCCLYIVAVFGIFIFIVGTDSQHGVAQFEFILQIGTIVMTLLMCRCIEFPISVSEEDSSL